MKKTLLSNIAFNLSVAAIFVFLNMKALELGYEETFVVYALIYGVVVTVGNGLFMSFGKK